MSITSNILLLVMLLSCVSWAALAAQSPTDTLSMYTELCGDYEFYFEERYRPIRVFLEDGVLTAQQRGHDPVVLEAVDLEKLQFSAFNGCEHFQFVFKRGVESEITRFILVADEGEYLAERVSVTSAPLLFSAEQLNHDFEQARKIIERTHPALYRFTDRVTFDELYDGQHALISDSMSVEEFYRILVPITEKIGCGHTNFWMPEGWLSQPSAKYFPLRLTFIRGKVFVLDPGDNIPVGSEIVSINGIPMIKIMGRIMSAISADGFNRNYKLKRMEKMFPFQFAKQFGHNKEFVVQFIRYGEKEVEETVLSYADFRTAQRKIIGESVLDCDIMNERDTAILKMNNFDYYNRREKFFSFVDSCFSDISDSDIGNLILDLRSNDGGDPFCAAHLFSYLAHKPVPYFAEPYGEYEDLAEPIPLAANRFAGNLYTLIDGMGFSTTGHLCGLLKYRRIGTFIGTETGGSYTCNDASRYFHLKNTCIQLWVASGSFASAVENMPDGRGITPDHAVEARIEDLISGKDTVLEYALRLIDESEKK